MSVRTRPPHSRKNWVSGGLGWGWRDRIEKKWEGHGVIKEELETV